MATNNRIPKNSKSITYNQLSAFWLKNENKLKRIIEKDGVVTSADEKDKAPGIYLDKDVLNKKDVADRFEALLESLRKLLTNKKIEE